MSIDEQIETAWKEHYAETVSKTKIGPLSIGSFAAGYLAALRSLYVEVKPEDDRIRDSVECWARIQDRWYPGVYWKAADEIDFRPSSGLAYGSYSRTRFDSVIRVLSLPSPSDIFGRGE